MKTIMKDYGKWVLIAIVLLFASAGFLALGIVNSALNPDRDFNSPVTSLTPPSDTTAVYVSFNRNNAQVGKKLEASLHNYSGNSKLKYQWYVNNEKISGATKSTYLPTAKDLEKFISVVVSYGTGEASASLYCSELPVIYIDTTHAIGEEYTTGKMAMSGNEDYTVANTNFYYGDLEIKLRGNSTMYRDKSPYKIKLASKCDLFGMGANKHWVLLANDIDHTLIRNKLVYDFASDIGMESMSSLNVSLVVNNSYMGVYQLCEQIRIGNTRVNIHDWEDLAEDAASLIVQVKQETEGLSDGGAKLLLERLTEAMSNDLSWISSPYTFTYANDTYVISDYVDMPSVNGGFLLEMDFYSFEDISSVKTNFNQPLYFNSPAPEVAVTNPELVEYARKYVQSFEYALHSYDFTFHNDFTHYAAYGGHYDWTNGWTGTLDKVVYSDAANDGKHYTELFDINSLINNFMVCEFSMNWDCMKNSMFISKDINSLATISPVWDFDWAFGNRNMFSIDTYHPESWHTTNDYFTNEQFYQSVQWNRYLVKDPYFLLLAYNKYQEIRPTVIEDIVKKNGKLDAYRLELKAAANANDNKWSYSYGAYNGETFINAMDSLETFIDTRVSWLDKQFTSFDNFVNSLGYYIPSKDITIKVSDDGEGTVTVSDANIKNLFIQVNGNAYSTYVSVDGNKATFTIPAEALNAKGNNIVNVVALNANNQCITNGHSDQVYKNEIPVQNYKVF